MKAVVLYEYGGVDQLRYEDIPTPEPGPDEVQVRVLSTSVNPVDFKIRSGAMKDHIPLKLPAVLGRDLAGEVTSVGSGVRAFRAGDKVMGVVNHSYAEYLTTKADSLTLIPTGLDPEDAGALPLVLLTGAQLIEEGIQPEPGELILVTGAAGSVGRTAVFVARQHGARVIAGVRQSQKEETQSMRADSVLALDDDAEIAALSKLDAIADTVDGDTIGKLLAKLNSSGRLGTVLGKPAAAQKTGITVREVWSHPDPNRLCLLAVEFRDGRLEIPIAKRLPLSEIREAHQLAEKGAPGKIVLIP